MAASTVWRRKRDRDGDDVAFGSAAEELAYSSDARRLNPSGKKIKRAGSSESVDDSEGHYTGEAGDVVDGRCECCC
jgi:hypothetical protein